MDVTSDKRSTTLWESWSLEWGIVIVGMQEKPHAVTSNVISMRFRSLGRRSRPSKGFFNRQVCSVSHPVNEKSLEQRSSLNEFLKSHGEGQHLRLPVTECRWKRRFFVTPSWHSSQLLSARLLSGHQSSSVSRMRHKDSWRGSFERSSVSDFLFTLDSHKAIMLSLLPER